MPLDYSLGQPRTRLDLTPAVNIFTALQQNRRQRQQHGLLMDEAKKQKTIADMVALNTTEQGLDRKALSQALLDRGWLGENTRIMSDLRKQDQDIAKANQEIEDRQGKTMGLLAEFYLTAEDKSMAYRSVLDEMVRKKIDIPKNWMEKTEPDPELTEDMRRIQTQFGERDSLDTTDGTPASLVEFEAVKKMSPEDRELYFKTKRGEQRPSSVREFEYGTVDPRYIEFLKEKRDLPPEKKKLDYAKYGLDVEKGKREAKRLKMSEEEAMRERSSKAASRATVSGFIARDLRFAKEYLDESADNPYMREAKSKVWTTTEYKLQNALDSIRKTIAIDQLLDIKRQGSGLGQVPQQQLEHLADLLGVISMRLPKDRIEVMLNDIQETYMDVLGRMTPEERAQVGIAEREFEMGGGGESSGRAMEPREIAPGIKVRRIR